MSTTLLPEYFNLSFLSGNISSFIIQRDGVNLTPKKNYYNFFHMLEKDERNKEIEKEMKEKLANGDHGYITFKLNNKTRYAYFSDVEGTNWYLLSVLPHSYVTERINHNLTHTLLLAGKVCVLLLIIGIYLLYLMNESVPDNVTLETITDYHIVPVDNNNEKINLYEEIFGNDEQELQQSQKENDYELEQ